MKMNSRLFVTASVLLTLFRGLILFVLIRVSAYMDPSWNATAPMDWWTIINRCRAIENTAYAVAANQAARLSYYPPYS